MVEKISLPLISVFVPVFGTEPFLSDCLSSIVYQSYPHLEIVIINDCSTGKDSNGWKCKKIVRKTEKALKKSLSLSQSTVDNDRQKITRSFVYIEHSVNLGLIETRREGVQNSSGDYITMVDSDDTLPTNAISDLFDEVCNSNADIVHGKIKINADNNLSSTIYEKLNAKVSKVYLGQIEKKDLINSFLVEPRYCGFLCGKLIKREVYIKAFEQIPYSYCVMNEDFLILFFVVQFANRYSGIDSFIYNYNVDTGISSHRKITNLKRWKQVCSTASVYTILFSYVDEHPLTDEQMVHLQQTCRFMLINNLVQLKSSVIPELQPQAYAMLQEYWGASLVDKAEQALSVLKSENQPVSDNHI